ncbi:DUF6177 family protein [Curtobacterium aurantiacum]|uniref:Uncharacterized protein n=1 Tax=Curtobacterium aurantiacum TaxID=3236919 RepID=A0ABS5VFG4_9MICO|nr:DUF6177 family protein [Curtobacterium flaccumfaciens]MBT1545419.1 hypothetical protein [Curtobacterium flaccumfaciens pv. flaccumfaciens]MBT1588223.1 hypothetical protein [Curtobacterium flaccumfaciens pv. flaccumfaciens]MBT1676753.1 hypothetical protein [Curtobacterium flaccumfaciens pv. flaccumfaciens]MBT1680186.1 hypothetical protein [Curtobacterium flaccumfaciens pv. flaccumfaciens]
MDDVTLAHPLVDAVGPGFVVSETDAAIVSLSSARMGLVLETRAADLAFVLLTPPTSRVTPAMLAMLRRTSSAWVVREGDRYRAAGSTEVVDDVATAMLAPQASERTTRLGPDEVPWVELIVSVHHPATEQAGIGRTAELLLEGLAGSAPTAWGTVEPATLAWSVGAVTDFARGRAPRPTRLVAVTPVDGGFAAVQLRIERSATGVTEETRLALPRPGPTPPVPGRRASGGPAVPVGRGTVPVPGNESPPVDGPVVDVLADLARRQRVLLATAWRSAGHADATLAARQRGMPVPLGAVVGAAAVRDLGVDAGSLPVGATPVGPPRVPSLLLDFSPPAYLTGGAEVEARWRRLAELGTALGPRAVELLGSGADR